MEVNETNELFLEVEQETYPPADPSRFIPITSKELIDILGLTIKRDETNKLVSFLSQLSAYTSDSQLNVSFNAPSSTGKSYNPLEISQLFPPEDVIKLGGCSPTAFFHEQGAYDKETNTIRIDLSRKIIIFLDQPHAQLLEKLRSFLSHDEKEIKLKITDKNQKGGNRTKTVILIGFPVVIFCTAGLSLDEQEATRFLLLSPEISFEKIREAIFEKIDKETNRSEYRNKIESNPQRNLLKERILAIREEGISEIRIGSPDLLREMFMNSTTKLKPRHQRDIGKVISLIKVFALLNLWHRERDGSVLIANEDDIHEAFKIWSEISESQELNLPPYVYNLFKDVIVEAYRAKNTGSDGTFRVGLARQDIMVKHYEIYGRNLPDWQLRQQIIPLLETSGLITQENDPTDKRRVLIYPTALLAKPEVENNSESDSGVEKDLGTLAEEIFLGKTDTGVSESGTS